jgi:MFS family permease
MGDYLDVLRSPAGRLMVVSGVARLSWGIEGLALLFHVEDAADSFAAAGLAVGALGVTSAIFAPLRGALVDLHGGTAMLSLGLLAGALTAAIAITPAAGPEALSYIVLAGLTGVVAPPFTAWTRTGLARNLSGDRLRRAYTIDNVFEESAFVAGPLVAGLVIALATPGAALVLAAGLATFGGLALTRSPGAREWAPPRRGVVEGSRTGLNRALAVAFVALAGMGAGVGFVEVAVAAFAEGEGSEGRAGLILAGLSAGGILGALVSLARLHGTPVRGSARPARGGFGAARLARVGTGDGRPRRARGACVHTGVHRQLAAGRGALARQAVDGRLHLGIDGDERGRRSRRRGRGWARRRARNRPRLPRRRRRGPRQRRVRARPGAPIRAGSHELIASPRARGPRRGRSPQQARAHAGSLDRRPSTATK